jgi:phosphate transport system protein
MYREVTSMLSDVLRAYTENNVDLAISIPARDKNVDVLNHEITENLTVRMARTPARITEYLDLIFIARHLERAGDHVKNIAEDVVFAIAAEDIRHMGAQRPGTAADLLGEKATETESWKSGETLAS